ncbi:MAG: sigma-70 family RNA polymerase sigma factor [Planctomycetaceae bacterium]|nr:sigma-70 family RNA polymerase sigma factor [Planctomycetaceae bacterium]
MPTSSVANVVSACQQGDRRAQRALYDEFHRQVYRLATRMVGQDDADDLSQQIFLQVFQKIDQFEGRSLFSTWLYRLATNECLQHLRSRAKKTVVTLAQQSLDASSLKSPLLDNSELLQTALDRLEPDLRSIFLLREIEELTYSELSEALQISEGTVASRLNRARMQLRQHLVDFGWEP